jgi:hypothetical protein
VVKDYAVDTALGLERSANMPELGCWIIAMRIVAKNRSLHLPQQLPRLT